MHKTLMATHPDSRGQGLGTQIMNYFAEHIKRLGFNKIVLLTVPPHIKPVYKETVSFYEKHGFKISKVYEEVWESGALEMIRKL